MMTNAHRPDDQRRIQSAPPPSREPSAQKIGIWSKHHRPRQRRSHPKVSNYPPPRRRALHPRLARVRNILRIRRLDWSGIYVSSGDFIYLRAKRVLAHSPVTPTTERIAQSTFNMTAKRTHPSNGDRCE
eukprot:1190582-Prorocentrum_minimum.AAC.1